MSMASQTPRPWKLGEAGNSPSPDPLGHHQPCSHPGLADEALSALASRTERMFVWPQARMVTCYRGKLGVGLCRRVPVPLGPPQADIPPAETVRAVSERF